jgi:hypothetical protein
VTEPSDRQKRIWTTAPPGDIPREVLSLVHPSFVRTHHLTTHWEGFFCEVRGVRVEAVPHGFQARLPQLDDSGRYEMQISLFNSGPAFARELAAAGASGTPVLADYNVYGATGEAAIRPGLRFELGGFAAQGSNVTASATLGDLVNVRFPVEYYRRDLFPGLDRI